MGISLFKISFQSSRGINNNNIWNKNILALNSINLSIIYLFKIICKFLILYDIKIVYKFFNPKE